MGKNKKRRKKARKQERKNARLFADAMLRCYGEPHVTLKTDCIVCHAEMSGAWYGAPPWMLVCANCSASYTVGTGIPLAESVVAAHE